MPAYSAQRPDQYYERDVITDWPRGPRGPRPSAVKNDEFTRKKQSRGRRMVRAVARLFIAVLIGVGATLAWQSHGDQATEMVRTWAPSLSWLLPISTKLPRDDQASTAAVAAHSSTREDGPRHRFTAGNRARHSREAINPPPASTRCSA